MRVQIVYASPERQFWVNVEMPEGTTVKDAVIRSDVLRQFPEINLETQKIGVFGKVVGLDTPLGEGDRVEIYRPLVADPKQVKQRKAGAAEPG